MGRSLRATEPLRLTEYEAVALDDLLKRVAGARLFARDEFIPTTRDLLLISALRGRLHKPILHLATARGVKAQAA